MSQEIPSPTKVTRRSVVIALAIVCTILAASLVGTTVYLISTANSTINQKDSVITDLNDTVNLQKYTVWVNNETVSQTAGNYTSWTFLTSVPVAGYFEVTTTSTTNNTYVEVIWNASVPVGFDFNGVYHYIGSIGMSAWYDYHSDNRVTVQSWTTSNVFPVLPWLPASGYGTSVVEIRVGNTNTVDNATETVLVTYYY